MVSKKTYHGTRFEPGHVSITIQYHDEKGDETYCEPLFHVIKHSPTGMEWGYAGSGPSDTALSILTDHMGSHIAADPYYQQFKFDHVSRWDSRWSITSAEIDDWLLKQMGVLRTDV